MEPGDRFICYMTKASRWFAVTEVLCKSFIDETPLYAEQDDPFVVRFNVRTVVLLTPELGIPALDDIVWTKLSFTRNQSKHSSAWANRIRGSLSRLDEEDGRHLESVIAEQEQRRLIYPLDKALYATFAEPVAKIPVAVPTDTPELAQGSEPNEVRESIQVQALLAQIGSRLGFRVWLPPGDRAAVLRVWTPEEGTEPLTELPLTYDADTNKTIQQIDVLWLKRRAIVRAFEVEHTTAIYSGILRMADLLALQPNINIKLHIVAPLARRPKVFSELLRPVFAYLESGPLATSCSYLSYDSLRELAREKFLAHLSDSVLDEYEEFAEEAD